METKSDLREMLKRRRLSMSTQQVRRLSDKITTNFLETVGLESIKNLHVFIPIEKFNEVNTWPLIHKIWQERPSIRIAIPDFYPKDKFRLEAIQISPQTKWQEVNGITKPVTKEALPPGYKFDLIIVPLLGFDKTGQRIGYGGGYYDHFLKAQPQALSVGLGFEIARLEKIPSRTYDVPLKKVITEKTHYG